MRDIDGEEAHEEQRRDEHYDDYRHEWIEPVVGIRVVRGARLPRATVVTSKIMIPILLIKLFMALVIIIFY